VNMGTTTGRGGLMAALATALRRSDVSTTQLRTASHEQLDALTSLFDPVHVFRHSRPPTIKLRGCHYRGISRRSRVGACQFPGATLAGMAFKVNREPEPPLSFGDKDKFEIVNGGVLKIRRANRTNLYISPGMWASIEEAPSPSAGPSPRVQDGRDA
jgi:hypothetical protein